MTKTTLHVLFSVLVMGAVARGQLKSLDLRPQKDQVVKYRWTATIQQTTRRLGAPLETETTLQQDLELRIEEVEPGKSRGHCVLTRVVAKISNPRLGVLEFDSEKKSKEPLTAALVPLWSLVGKKLPVTFTHQGVVEDEAPPAAGKKDPTQEATNAGRALIRRLLERTLGTFRPQQPVALGTQWIAAPTEFESQGGLPFRFEGQHVLKSLDDPGAVVETQGTLALDEDELKRRVPVLANFKVSTGQATAAWSLSEQDGFVMNGQVELSITLTGAGTVENVTRIKLDRIDG